MGLESNRTRCARERKNVTQWNQLECWIFNISHRSMFMIGLYLWDGNLNNLLIDIRILILCNFDLSLTHSRLFSSECLEQSKCFFRSTRETSKKRVGIKFLLRSCRGTFFFGGREKERKQVHWQSLRWPVKRAKCAWREFKFKFMLFGLRSLSLTHSTRTARLIA